MHDVADHVHSGVDRLRSGALDIVDPKTEMSDTESMGERAIPDGGWRLVADAGGEGSDYQDLLAQRQEDTQVAVSTAGFLLRASDRSPRIVKA